MKNAIKLATLSLAQLAAVYNTLSEKQIKKFGEHGTAEIRVEKLLAAGKLALVTVALPGSKLVTEGVYIVSIAKPAPKAKNLVLQAAAKRVVTEGARFGDDMVITVLVDANPKKSGSMAAGRFALYVSGMTVAAYREAIVAHDAALGFSRKQAMLDSRNDLVFDTERDYIEVK